ncbi:winged helix-turn-helix domain-containing protein [Serratia sp. B1]|uniref:winged helix-turn-helix domain-containing protein n=1 Tax=Serratia ureilytica TaxID=300181 RepID=UPI001E58F67B|nr:winged helix-turn-helix domain-containing protein [Serratia ureilytica]WIF05733.1 winged helix-turn-helix domain-containing protein [Serratia sp. B1]
MIYIIDKDITFNTENGSLKSLKKGREVFLSSVNARVFKCLLEHGHETVSRETLLQQVWTDHGLSASSATLNQYISLTRRALTSVGFNERLIVTLSKKGYRLNRIIPVDRLRIDLPEPPQLADAAVTLASPAATTKNTHHYFLFCCAVYRSSYPYLFWRCASSITSTIATVKRSRYCPTSAR